MSNNQNPVYTHFRGKNISRVELMERMLVEIIMKSKLPDQQRVWGKVFELKHSSSVIQLGRVLAQKRGLNEEMAVIICAFHDVYVDHSGKAKDHAKVGAIMAEKILRKTKKFKDKEIGLIANAIKEHSNKHIVAKNPYVELVKDADVFDCSLYEGMHDAYIFEKPTEICRTYFDRIKKVRKELGLPQDSQWDKLEYLKQGKKYYEKHKK